MSKKPSKASKLVKITKSAAKAATSREEQNGVTRPGAGTLCARVWEVLDKLHAKGEELSFETVRERAGKEMADATIRTQRQRWNEFHGITRDSKKPASKKVAAKQAAAPAVVTAELPPAA
jgi:hypothetical protein